MELLFVSSDQTLSIGAKEKHNNRTAPVNEINQYVEIDIFPILIFGNNSIDNVTDMNVKEEIIIVGIIKTQVLLCAFFRNVA